MKLNGRQILLVFACFIAAGIGSIIGAQAFGALVLSPIVAYGVILPLLIWGIKKLA